MANNPVCGVITAKGTPCARPCVTGYNTCQSHDPTRERIRADHTKDMAKKSVRARDEVKVAVKLETVTDVVRLLAKLINEVYTDTVDLNKAKTIASISSTMLRALELLGAHVTQDRYLLSDLIETLAWDRLSDAEVTRLMELLKQAAPPTSRASAIQ